MARLFVSYARKDGAEFSRRLQTDLKGHEAWLDQSGIAGGESWTRAIEREIDSCHAFVAVLTPAYHESRVSEMELQRASRKEKLLLPLKLDSAAETPLLLETTQYLDFTSPDRYSTNLASLLERLALLSAESTAGSSAPPQAREAGHGEGVRARLAQKTSRFVRENQGTPKAPGRFIPELYVRREGAEQTLSRFLSGPSAALILVGDTGVGKTNLLCRWVLDLMEEGHTVLPYAADALADADVEREIARDLDVTVDQLPGALAQLDTQASRDRRNLVVVFDSINEYGGSGRNGTLVLIRRLNSFVGRLPGPGVRVVLSCSSATWSRLQRLDPLRFDHDLYLYGADDDPTVRLEGFTDQELASAYALYRAKFELSWVLEALPPSLRERLRHPFLLRLMAEAYRGLDQPPASLNLALAIYRRFFDERVRAGREGVFVDELADEMLRQQASLLPISELARHGRLGPQILEEEPSSTYQRLLDRGVLQETHADARLGPSIKFPYTGLAAYALARRARQVSTDDARTATALVAQAARFPLAWEVAKTVLWLGRAPNAFDALATSSDVEQRELAVEALVGLHTDDPQAATALIDRLLGSEAEEARRTALKAAYYIGPPARDIFLRTALEGGPALRQSLKDTLYLIWRRDSPGARRKTTDTLYLMWRQTPGFTYEFLHDLLGQIGLRNVRRIRPILDFVLDLSIVIYINHCDQADVVQNTARLYHELATERLHLDLLNTGLLGPRFERLVFRSVARVFSERILGWMLFGDVVPVQRFFELPKERRACLGRIADALEPGADLGGVRDDLAAMLPAEIPVFGGAAGLAVSVHAYRDFRSTEPLVRRLFDELPAAGRLWLLLSFAVLLPDTPSEWRALLEALTERYIREHRDAFLEPSRGPLANLDIVLLPLGLAYGKQGPSMPLFERLLSEAAAAGDQRLLARVIAALGPVGFYYPQATLDALPKLGGPDGGPAEAALVSSLATIRTIHFDAVDQFLDRAQVPEGLRHRIDAAADVALVHRYIHVLGYYNNAVHYITHYPRMRRQLAMGALKLLAEAPDAARFVGDYTAVAVQMFRNAGFQLLEWTRPD